MSVIGRLRVVRRTAELIDLVRELRRVEPRAEVLIDSGPIDVPAELDDNEPTERMHASSLHLGG